MLQRSHATIKAVIVHLTLAIVQRSSKATIPFVLFVNIYICAFIQNSHIKQIIINRGTECWMLFECASTDSASSNAAACSELHRERLELVFDLHRSVWQSKRFAAANTNHHCERRKRRSGVPESRRIDVLLVFVSKLRLECMAINLGMLCGQLYLIIFKVFHELLHIFKACGAGTIQQSRSILVQATCGCAICNGSPTQSIACMGTTCPVNCAVSTWTNWSNCSPSCGTSPGSRTRTRTVTQQALNGGRFVCCLYCSPVFLIVCSL